MFSSTQLTENVDNSVLYKELYILVVPVNVWSLIFIIINKLQFTDM